MQYTYDVFNHLVAEVVYQNGTLLTTIANIYDGDNLLKQFTAAGTGSFSLSKRFLDGPAVDEVLAEEDMTQTFGTASRVLWYVDDNQGSTRELVDNSGNVVSNYNYTPYGQVLAGDTSLTQALYSGGLYDPFTGLQYNSADGGGRWYDPAAGRWLQQDPIGILGGDYNLGRYVGDAPTNATDPSGLAAEAGTLPLPLGVAENIARTLSQAAAQSPAAYNLALRNAVALVATLYGVKFNEGQLLHNIRGRGLDDILANDDLFDRYMKHKFPADCPLSDADAKKVWDKLVEKGKNPIIHNGHPTTKWPGPHINVPGGPHIPVGPGFAP